MSKVALDSLIDIVEDGNAKAFGNETLKLEFQTFELSKDLITKAVFDQIKEVINDKNFEFNNRLGDFYITKAWLDIKKALIEKIPKATSENMNHKKQMDYIDTGRSIIIRAYAPGKDNYGRIYTQIFKPGVSKTRPIFEKLLENILSIYKLSDKYRANDEKPNESPFILGHSRGGSNIKYLMAEKFRQVMTDPTKNVGDIKQTFQEIKIAWDSIVLGTLSEPGEAVNFLISAASEFTGSQLGDGKKTLTITMEVQSRTENAKYGATKEAQIRKAFKQSLENLRKSKGTEFWINHESSDSPARRVSKVLFQEAYKAGFKVDNKLLLEPIDVKANKVSRVSKVKSKSKVKKNVSTVRITGGKSKVGRPLATPSYISLMTLINERLPPRVRANMGSPRLNNRTGRFSESARVTNILSTATGTPSIEYEYQRSPYDVFDKHLGKSPWNTPERDPSDLVSMSVRQLAQELGLKKFTTRRAR